MRAALWLLLIAALAVAVALLLRVEGYVIVVYPPWRVEMSVALAAGLVVLAIILAYLLVRLLGTTLRLPAEVRAWRERRRRGKADADLGSAVGALLSGQAAHARRLAQQALDLAPTPLAALVAARAALDLGELGAAQALLETVVTEQGELIAARQALQRELAEAERALQTAAPVGQP